MHRHVVQDQGMMAVLHVIHLSQHNIVYYARDRDKMRYIHGRINIYIYLFFS